MLELFLLTLLTLLASGVGTLTGFGTSTLMVPVLVLIYPLPQSLLLVGIIHWFGNIWKMILFRSGIRWKILLAFGIPGIAASLWGASLAIEAPLILLSRILGAFLVSYVVILILKPNFRLPQNPLPALMGGALGGFLAGIFGIGGAVRSTFLSMYDLPKVTYIFTAGAVGWVIDSTRLATYWASGARLEPPFLGGLLLFIPASFLGAKIAQQLTGKIPQEKFRRVIAAFLLFVGLKLLLAPH